MSKSKIMAITAYLSQFITDQKKERVEQVLAKRTRHVTVVLENLFQEHNASAIVRTAENFGLTDIHAIEHDYHFCMIRGMEVGSAKWINLHRYGQTQQCINQLKQHGYHVIATTLNTEHSITLHSVPIESKIAVLFGTEKSGLTQQALDLADQHATIPMHGFTQSFNVSVSVALCLQSIINRIHAGAFSWQLSPREVLQERLQWYRKIVKHSEKLEQYYHQNYQNH